MNALNIKINGNRTDTISIGAKTKSAPDIEGVKKPQIYRPGTVVLRYSLG